VRRLEAHFGEPAIGFNDPSGLRFELMRTIATRAAVDRGRRPRARFAAFHSVQMMVGMRAIG
jgi:hypothetical protein